MWLTTWIHINLYLIFTIEIQDRVAILIFINIQHISHYIYLKGAYYMGIRVFNNPPVLIKQLYNNPIDFKLAVKGFLGNHSFYTLDEYFDCRFDKNNDIIHL
jgi:4-hydroxybenzoate polyprenyltransferase